MICPRAASLPIAASKTAKWGSDQSAEVFVPASDFSSNQMHKDSVMGRCSFAVSLASDGPIPLDGQPSSVLGEKHLVYIDLQISEILEIIKDRALYVLLEHETSRETTFRSVANRRQRWQRRASPALALDGSRARVPARCRSWWASLHVSFASFRPFPLRWVSTPT